MRRLALPRVDGRGERIGGRGPLSAAGEESVSLRRGCSVAGTGGDGLTGRTGSTRLAAPEAAGGGSRRMDRVSCSRRGLAWVTERSADEVGSTSDSATGPGLSTLVGVRRRCVGAAGESGRCQRAFRKSRQEGKRSRGSLARALATMGWSALGSARRSGSSLTCCSINWRLFLPANGRSPVSNCRNTAARLYWSLCGLTEPRQISGEAYAGVKPPVRRCGRPSGSGARLWTRPKSKSRRDRRSGTDCRA